MKTQNTGTKAKENLPKGNKSTRPENKDNLDSRSGEEQDNKGSDVTHNQREKHSENKKQK